MKAFNYSLLGLGILLFFACNSTEKQSEIPILDVTKSYPEKEVFLQDIADVEYIPLETRDDALVALGDMVVLASDKLIITGGRLTGDICFFDGQGKFLSKFNHKGQSGREYQELWDLFYDSNSKELYIVDIIYRHRILIYDLEGNYKRTISFPEDVFFGRSIINFDSEKLLCYDEVFGNAEEASRNPFQFVDKQTGKIIDSLALPFQKRVNPSIKTSEKGSVRPIISPIVCNDDEIVLSEISCDTIYTLSKNKQLTPLVVRTPKVRTEATTSIFQVSKITPRYIFSNVVLMKPNGVRGYPPTTYLAINRKTFEIIEYKLQNADALNVLGTCYSLIESPTLLEALSEQKLTGKLKEIAENLNEDDNPVLVKVKFKE